MNLNSGTIHTLIQNTPSLPTNTVSILGKPLISKFNAHQNMQKYINLQQKLLKLRGHVQISSKFAPQKNRSI